jgi:hypothetical protein
MNDTIIMNDAIIMNNTVIIISIGWQNFFFQTGFVEDQRICFICNFLISFFDISNNIFSLNWQLKNQVTDGHFYFEVNDVSNVSIIHYQVKRRIE